MTRLGALLRLHRSVHGISLTLMADGIGITRHQLSAIEQDRGGGSQEAFAKVLIWLLARADLAPRLAADVSAARESSMPDKTDAPGVADSVADAVAE
jgi:transcriptional regulator with XRE-family HTH domain